MLHLIWLAEFKEKKIITQFDDIHTQTGEHSFKEVLDRQDDLIRFALINTKTNVAYVLNLENGTLGITLRGLDCLEPDMDMLRKDSYKYRLIYFRRVRRNFTPQLIEVGDADITYFIGFQYNDTAGQNHKKLFKISTDGRIVSN